MIYEGGDKWKSQRSLICRFGRGFGIARNRGGQAPDAVGDLGGAQRKSRLRRYLSRENNAVGGPSALNEWSLIPVISVNYLPSFAKLREWANWIGTVMDVNRVAGAFNAILFSFSRHASPSRKSLCYPWLPFALRALFRVASPRENDSPKGRLSRNPSAERTSPSRRPVLRT